MTLSEYVKKRNGVPIGHSASLKNNLWRSFGARNFSVFWNYWNPIFGYYLGTKIFKPLKKILPMPLATILTFIFCGLVHDLVTTLIRRKISLFFSVWFLFMGMIVTLTKYFDYDLSKKHWMIRAIVNFSIIAICLLLTIFMNMQIGFF